MTSRAGVERVNYFMFCKPNLIQIRVWLILDQLDGVVISHTHYDHMDSNSIYQLHKK